MRVWVSFLFVMVLLLPIVSAQGIPGDLDGDGCVNFTEISAFVVRWMNNEVNFTQVSHAVAAWLQDCTPPPTNNEPLYSAAYELTWPPPIVNDGKYGAESNPTGDPIGGFYGYRRIVHPSQADFIVYNKDQFLSALQQVQPGQIIYVDDNSVIDLTGVWEINVPGNITIASGRGRNFSKGALIKNLEQRWGVGSSKEFLIIQGPNVRITGIRLEGPGKDLVAARHGEIFYSGRPDLASAYYHMGTSHGIYSQYPFLEVDNCEIFGWRAAGIYLNWNFYSNIQGSSENAYIHHNYIHHNPYNGLGYGVSTGYSNENRPISVLVEANLFNWNRHSVASTGNPYNSYEARYNLVLWEDRVTFDRHQNNGWGGDYTFIHHNTLRHDTPSGTNVAISGVYGPYKPDGVNIYNNWFYTFHLPVATSGPNTNVFNNFRYIFPPAGVNLPVASISVDKDTVSLNQPISFSASESTGGTYGLSYVCWDFGDLSEEVCSYPHETKTHSYSKPGRYTVTLRVVDTKGILDTKSESVIVYPGNPDAVILSFWVRDSYNQYNQGSLSGYFKKKVLIDNNVVWERDLNSDGNEWEHVVLDITSYVNDVSEFNFQIESLQNYQSPLYPEFHPFEFFEVYVDDMFIFNRDYSYENFGDWEDTKFDNGFLIGVDGKEYWGFGAVYMYKEGDPWWSGEAYYDSFVGGVRGYKFDSRYRMNSTNGSTRGIKQTIYAPKGKVILDLASDSKGVVKDSSTFQKTASFEGRADNSNNLINDFFGYSKRLNGDTNYVVVNSVDLSQNWVLDMNVFLPDANSVATLMYANNGGNYVHVYYSPTNQVVLKTNSAEVSCNLPSLSHSRFNKIVVGRSCVGSTCTLSCANNGVVNAFSGNPTITLSGTSTVSFGGYVGGSTNLFGAFNRIKLLRGQLTSSDFADLSKDKLQGAWYFREGTNGIIKDSSIYQKNVNVPSNINFGSDGSREYASFTSSSQLTIPRDPSMVVGKEFSLELIVRFNDLSSNHFDVVRGFPYTLANRRFVEPGYPDGRRIHFSLFVTDRTRSFGDGPWYGVYGIRPVHELKDNTWYHLLYTKYDDYLRVYVNGVLNKKIYVPDIPYNTSEATNLIMGYFNGDVQRFSVFDKALLSHEAEAIYESSALGCSDADNDGYGAFPRSGVINGCRFDGFDCNDNSAGVYPGNGC